MTAMAASFKTVIPSDYYVAGSDIHISYLPLAHIFERTAILVMLYCGTAIGYFRGDNLKLLEDLQELKPTFFNAVPRVISRIVDTVQNTVDAKAIVKFLFNRAYSSKASTLASQGTVSKDTMYDKIMFKKIQAVTGGRVKNSGCL
jgi:long-chain acyl-CoA synthetase